MKAMFLSFFLLVFASSIAQNPCRTSSGGSFPGDEPPGCTLCNSVYSGSTIGFSSDNETYDFLCGNIEISQWLSFFVNEDGKVNFDLTTSNCDQGKGIEAALYDKDLNLISSCVAATNQSDSLNIFVENLDPGDLYLLMVDGVDSDICDFRLRCTGCSFKKPDPIIELVADPPFDQVCKGIEICYSFAPVAFATHYQWEFTTELLDPISGGGLTDTFLCVLVNDWGFGNVTVTPVNGCQSGNTVFSNFTSFELSYIYPYTVCPEDSLPVDTCYKVGIGCDSCISYNVIPISNPVVSIDYFLCDDECFQLGDTCISEPGFHRIIVESKREFSCDSIVLLNLDVRNVLPSPTLTCDPIPEGIMIEWIIQSGADAYIVSVNRDSVATVIGNSYLIENMPSGQVVNIKVQPVGSCTYLPAEISCISSTSSANQDFLNRSINVFPNPTTGKLNIETDLIIEEIEIYDTASRLLQKENTETFDLEYREAGVYFLKIKTKEGVGMKRILMN